MDFKLNLTQFQKQSLQKLLNEARSVCNSKIMQRVSALLGLSSDQSIRTMADILCVSKETIRQWIRDYLNQKMNSLKLKPKSGRPPKLTKTQRKTLFKLIAAGPQAAGFPGACWRTPMIQKLIQDRFNVTYNIHYISELLKNMGFSFQRATFIASQRNAEDRNKWLFETWPEIIKLQKERNAYIFFGDECSFAQWGSLSRTWAPKGQTPVVKTKGTRKNYKVFGAIEYTKGHFISQGTTEKLNAESYISFLKKMLKETRKPIILIQDGALYHTSQRVKLFIKDRQQRLTVYTLPSYSPDYNPIEKLWKKIKENYTHLHYFETYDALINTVDNAMKMSAQQSHKMIKPLFAMYEKLLHAA